MKCMSCPVFTASIVKFSSIFKFLHAFYKTAKQVKDPLDYNQKSVIRNCEMWGQIETLEELESDLGMSTEISASFGSRSGKGKFSLSEKSKLTRFCSYFSVIYSSEHDLPDLLVHRGDSYPCRSLLTLR